MKKSELKRIIREEILREEYTESMSLSWGKIVSAYMKWEKSSFENFPGSENKRDDEAWSTKDAKIEVLQDLLRELNKKSKRKDKIKIS